MCFTVQLSRFFRSVSQTARLFYLISFCLSSTFFKFFQTFLSQDFVVVLSTTWILYHIFCLLSTVNFIFLKFFLIVCFSKTIICNSSVIITLGVVVVNHKIQFFLIFVEVYFYRAIFPIILVAFINRNSPLLGALHRSHFQCGKCEGRRSQSSEARTPSLALPPRWARKEFFVVVCGAVLTFVCMLRYSEWDAVPIWVPGFFGTYSGMLY